VDQIFSDAVAAGASPMKKPQPASWGGYSGYFEDLDRYLWEVAFNPFTWIGPEDEKAQIIESK
jgi:predicted lactoylglutathione lyase